MNLLGDPCCSASLFSGVAQAEQAASCLTAQSPAGCQGCRSVIGAVLSAVLPALFFLHPPVSGEGAWGLTEQTGDVLGILSVTEKSRL